MGAILVLHTLDLKGRLKAGVYTSHRWNNHPKIRREDGTYILGKDVIVITDKGELQKYLVETEEMIQKIKVRMSTMTAHFGSLQTELTQKSMAESLLVLISERMRELDRQKPGTKE